MVYTRQYTRHMSSFFPSVSSDSPGCDGACCARAGLRSGWAALSSYSVYIIAAGHLLESSQDTRRNLAHFLVCVRDLSLLVVSVAPTWSHWNSFVVHFYSLSRAIFTLSSTADNFMFIVGSGPFRCLRLLSIGAHFPSPEVLLPADDITAYEYLLTLRVF